CSQVPLAPLNGRWEAGQFGCNRQENSKHNATASLTAIYTSIARAAHQQLDQKPKVIDDQVVGDLVEGSSESQTQAQANDFLQTLQRLARELFVMCNRLAEDELRRSVEASAVQYLILGAVLNVFA
ncbi:class I SAM-dependent methyltransferase, partial [Pseudomonas aeruginosa]